MCENQLFSNLGEPDVCELLHAGGKVRSGVCGSSLHGASMSPTPPYLLSCASNAARRLRTGPRISRNPYGESESPNFEKDDTP